MKESKYENLDLSNTQIKIMSPSASSHPLCNFECDPSYLITQKGSKVRSAGNSPVFSPNKPAVERSAAKAHNNLPLKETVKVKSG